MTTCSITAPCAARISVPGACRRDAAATSRPRAGKRRTTWTRTSPTTRRMPQMNPDLEHLLRSPWTVARVVAGDLQQVTVETEPDGRPVCTVGVLCGDRRADLLTAAVARALAALPRLVL